jgi:putative ABC transport system ATP-binding protein
MMIKVEQLTKSYRQGHTDVVVLKNLNLSVLKGETIAILGHSGSGKTTLLSILAGLEKPTEGKLFLNNSPIHQMNERDLTTFRAQHLGIVFQQYHLLDNLTALENVQLPLEILGNKKKEGNSLPEYLLEEVGISQQVNGRQHHFPHQLSGGECQRVAIARALVNQPSILLADEPSGNLDKKTGEKVMNLLFNLVKSHKTTLLLVTHNEELAKQCDRKLILEEGSFHL